MKTTSKAISFTDLMIMEPRLAVLAKDIKAVKGDADNFCANWHWYKHFKPRLVSLVGDSAEDVNLQTSMIYDLAYETLYQMLPECKNCFCFRM